MLLFVNYAFLYVKIKLKNETKSISVINFFYRVAHVTFEDPLAAGTESKIRNSRLQIVVVCPVLLERVAERPEQATNISRQLIADKVLAMMLGVYDVNLNARHRTNLVSYQHWKKFFVKDQDETFVGLFLGAAVAILGNAPSNSLKLDKTAFSVHPKKVKTVSRFLSSILIKKININRIPHKKTGKIASLQKFNPRLPS